MEVSVKIPASANVMVLYHIFSSYSRGTAFFDLLKSPVEKYRYLPIFSHLQFNGIYGKIHTVKGGRTMEFNKENERRLSIVFKALGHPARVFIIRQLLKEQHRVSDFVNAINVEFATVSRHLAKLKRVGLVKCTKKGREIFYSINMEQIKKYNDEMRGIDA